MLPSAKIKPINRKKQMNEITNLCAAVVAGIFLGALFFGGLWWTTKKGLVANQPALWFLGSLIGRTSLVLAGLYYVSGEDWRRLVACLAGLMIARITMLRVFSSTSLSQSVTGMEEEHES
jgi:F1F0 ATPase subunit 2